MNSRGTTYKAAYNLALGPRLSSEHLPESENIESSNGNFLLILQRKEKLKNQTFSSYRFRRLAIYHR